MLVEQPDILIIEGLNILQPAEMPKDGGTIPFVSDFIDFSIYIDADPAVIEKWYLTRFMRLRLTAFRDPGAYFHKYAALAPDEVRRIALKLWREINFKNLEENILPTRRRAQLILQKGESHRVEVGVAPQALDLIRTKTKKGAAWGSGPASDHRRSLYSSKALADVVSSN